MYYFITHSTLPPPPSLLPPFQNRFLLLNNQRPTQVLSWGQKSNFSPKMNSELTWKVTSHFLTVKVFRDVKVEFLLNQHFAQGSGALWGVVVSMGLGGSEDKAGKKAAARAARPGLSRRAPHLDLKDSGAGASLGVWKRAYLISPAAAELSGLLASCTATLWVWPYYKVSPLLIVCLLPHSGESVWPA